MNFCFVENKIVPGNKACIPVEDLGLLRSYAIFDYLRTYKKRPFLIDKYLNRLENSAKEINLFLPVSKNKIKEIIQKLIELSSLDEMGIRILITGGSINNITKKPRLIILTEKLPQYPKTLYTKGAKIITYNFKRNLPYTKSTDYLIALKLEEIKKKHNAFEILYTSRKKVREMTRSNFFMFKGNTLITPKRDVLQGITRQVVLDIAKKFFKIEERDIYFEELKLSNETFLTGTTKKIVPIKQIDNIIYKHAPGKNTKLLMKAFDDFVNSNC